MSSFLFSPLCLDPLTGVLDFTADAKPFHTKVVEAGVSILFTDTLKVAFTEQLFMDIDQLFHTHTAGCKTEQTPCMTDGFESEVYDDGCYSFYELDPAMTLVQTPNGDRVFHLDVANCTYVERLELDTLDNPGFEPTIRYNLAEYPVGTPTIGKLNFIGYSARGNPVFIVPELCEEPEPPCPEGFETSAYDIAYYDFSDPECISSCNSVYIGPCSTPSTTASCVDNTPTTLSTTFAEFLTIEDDDGIILDVIGSVPFDPIYAHNPVTLINLEVVTADNRILYHG